MAAAREVSPAPLAPQDDDPIQPSGVPLSATVTDGNTRAVRFLKASGTPHDILLIDRSGMEGKRKTAASSELLGISEHRVIKSLVFYDPKVNRHVLVLQHGDMRIDTKMLTRCLGGKRFSSCPPDLAQQLTGYLTGGISPFGLRTKLAICMEETIPEIKESIMISGGARNCTITMQASDIRKALESEYAFSQGYQPVTLVKCAVPRLFTEAVVGASEIDAKDSAEDEAAAVSVAEQCVLHARAAEELETFASLLSPNNFPKTDGSDSAPANSSGTSGGKAGRTQTPTPYDVALRDVGLFVQWSQRVQALLAAAERAQSAASGKRSRAGAAGAPDSLLTRALALGPAASDAASAALAAELAQAPPVSFLVNMNRCFPQTAAVPLQVSVTLPALYPHPSAVPSVSLSQMSFDTPVKIDVPKFETQLRDDFARAVNANYGTQLQQDTAADVIFSSIAKLADGVSALITAQQSARADAAASPTRAIGSGAAPVPGQAGTTATATATAAAAASSSGQATAAAAAPASASAASAAAAGPGAGAPAEVDAEPTTYMGRLDTNGTVILPSSPLVRVAPGEAIQQLSRPTANIKIGLVGLPNVGKSSLFNLISGLQVPAENYAFCTINPNHAVVPIMDPRYLKLVKAFNPPAATPPVVRVVDIAGLVKGASKGKGLGNAFLHHISTVQVIIQVVRAFTDMDIEHVEGTVNPVRDMDIITQELLAKDIERFTSRIEKLAGKKTRAYQGAAKEKERADELAMLLKAHEWLLRGNCLRHCKWTPAEVAYLSTLQTWTSKAVIYAVNMTAGQYCDPAARDRVCEPVRAWARVHSPESVVVPVSVPYEKAVLQCPSESSPRLLTAAAQVMSELAKGGDTQVARYVAAKDFDAAAEAFGPLVRPEWQKRAKEREGGDKKDKKAKAHANGHSHSHGHGHGHGHSHGHHDKSDKSDKGAKKAKKDKESVGFGDAFAEYLDDGDALGGPFATASAPAPADDDAVVVVETMEELEEVAGLDAIADLDALAARAEPVREAGAAAAAAASSSEAESKRGAGGDAAGSSSEEKDKAPVGIEPTADELIAMWRAIKSRAGSKRPRDDAAAAAGEGQGADDSRGGSGGSGEGFAATEVEVADDDDAGAEAEGGAGEGGRPGETEEGGAEAAAEGASGGPVKAAKGRVLTETNLSALFPLIHQCYQSGQLVHFFCCDRHAVRGYLVPQARCRAATAANRLHYDNEKNFLSCEVCAFSDWEASGKSMASAKASGLVRTCGREYLVQDFDIIKFKIAAKAKE